MILNNQQDNWDHYKQNNNRVPGEQITKNWGIDQRQKAIMMMIPTNGTILDLGTADGSLLILLYKQGYVINGIGIDLWEDGIKWGQQYCKNLPITLSVGAVEHYKGEQADYVILGEVLEHVIDPVEVLKVARANGKSVIITVPIARPPITEKEKETLDEHVRQYTLETLTTDCEAVGLKVQEAVQVGQGWVSLVVRCI